MAAGSWADHRAPSTPYRTEPSVVPSRRWPRIHRGRGLAGVLVGAAVSVVLVSAVLLPTVLLPIRAGHRATAANIHPASTSAPGCRDLLGILPERQSGL